MSQFGIEVRCSENISSGAIWIIFQACLKLVQLNYISSQTSQKTLTGIRCARKKKKKRKSEDSIWTLRNLVVIVFYVLQEIESGQVRANKIGRFLGFFFCSAAMQAKRSCFIIIHKMWLGSAFISFLTLSGVVLASGNTLSCKLQTPQNVELGIVEFVLFFCSFLRMLFADFKYKWLLSLLAFSPTCVNVPVAPSLEDQLPRPLWSLRRCL